MESGVVYLLTNEINGKLYVGQTCSMKHRMSAHQHDSRTKNAPLYSAMRKYGIEHFSCQILEFVQAELKDVVLDFLDEREQYWIALFGCTSNKHGYNQTSGGHSGRFNEETKRKISQIQKGRIPWNKGLIACSRLVRQQELAIERAALNLAACHTPSSKELLRQANLGKKHQLKAIEKVRIAATGNQHGSKTWQITSPDDKHFEIQNLKTFCEQNGLSYKTFSHYASVGKSLHGWTAVPDRVCSDETREKFRRASIGQKCPDNVKNKIADANIGNKHNAKQWIVEMPGCLPRTVTSLRSFCVEINACYSAIHRYAITGISPKSGKYAGWKISTS